LYHISGEQRREPQVPRRSPVLSGPPPPCDFGHNRPVSHGNPDLPFYHCYNVKVVVRKIGNSQGVILPKSLLAQLGEDATELEVSVDGDAIVLRKPAGPARHGWAEAARALGAALDGTVWPEFSNVGDRELRW